jgi:hypothetical protein
MAAMARLKPVDKWRMISYQFLPAVIRHAVWPYIRFALTYRDAKI